jgi:hypothetical protein
MVIDQDIPLGEGHGIPLGMFSECAGYFLTSMVPIFFHHFGNHQVSLNFKITINK